MINKLREALAKTNDPKMIAAQRDAARIGFIQNYAEALIDVAEAASVSFEPTVDRNVARRRMEALIAALARLEGKGH